MECVRKAEWKLTLGLFLPCTTLWQGKAVNTHDTHSLLEEGNSWVTTQKREKVRDKSRAVIGFV